MRGVSRDNGKWAVMRRERLGPSERWSRVELLTVSPGGRPLHRTGLPTTDHGDPSIGAAGSMDQSLSFSWGSGPEPPLGGAVGGRSKPAQTPFSDPETVQIRFWKSLRF